MKLVVWKLEIEKKKLEIGNWKLPTSWAGKLGYYLD